MFVCFVFFISELSIYFQHQHLWYKALKRKLKMMYNLVTVMIRLEGKTVDKKTAE